MRLLLILAAVTVVAAMNSAADEPKAKKHILKVSFSTPNPTWSASISEVRVVGKELWVKVDTVSSGGIAPAVIGTAEAEATVEAPALPVKYLVFGKKWGWKNEEEGITFMADQEKEAAAKIEKEWKGGKVVYEAKKGDKK